MKRQIYPTNNRISDIAKDVNALTKHDRRNRRAAQKLKEEEKEAAWAAVLVQSSTRRQEIEQRGLDFLLRYTVDENNNPELFRETAQQLYNVLLDAGCATLFEAPPNSYRRYPHCSNAQFTHYRQWAINLVEQREYWVRDIETWKCSGHNRLRKFKSLCAHLLATYAVPDFLYHASLGSSPIQPHYENWFRLLGSGMDVRELPTLPTSLSHQAAHIFMQTPSQANYSMPEALHRAQFLATGCSPHLAH